MDKRFSVYAGANVLVTGHTGFKGSWLVLWLKKLGANVIGYSLDPPSNPNMYESLDIRRHVKHYDGDIRDLPAMVETVQAHAPDIVFHLAAQPLVRASYKRPVETYETNVMGTVNVMESIRQVEGVRAFVNVTSDKCYENREQTHGYTEMSRFGGRDPYSSSKGCAELVFFAYLRSYFHPDQYGETHKTLCASVRAGNVIGGGDWGADRLLPDCVKAFHAGDQPSLRYPRASRPWQHVLEPLSGYLLLGAELLNGKPQFSRGWNFGPSDKDTWSVEQIVQRSAELWGDASYVVDSRPHAHEAFGLFTSRRVPQVRTSLGCGARRAGGHILVQALLWRIIFQSNDRLHFVANSRL